MKEAMQGKVLKGRESNIAWFRLAELISRGEKEKALNLYRLLSHSFENRAYVLQLEADLLWSFDDQEAESRYAQAAILYRKEHKVVSAIAIYEHLLTLQPTNHEYLTNVIELYACIEWKEKLKDRFRVLFGLVENKSIPQENVLAVIKRIIPCFSSKKLFDDFILFLKQEASDLVEHIKEGR